MTDVMTLKELFEVARDNVVRMFREDGSGAPPVAWKKEN